MTPHEVSRFALMIPEKEVRVTRLYDDDPAVLDPAIEYVHAQFMDIFLNIPARQRLGTYVYYHNLLTTHLTHEKIAIFRKLLPPHLHETSPNIIVGICFVAFIRDDIFDIGIPNGDYATVRTLISYFDAVPTIQKATTWLCDLTTDRYFIVDRKLITKFTYILTEEYFKNIDLKVKEIYSSAGIPSRDTLLLKLSYMTILGKLFGLFDTHPTAQHNRTQVLPLLYLPLRKLIENSQRLQGESTVPLEQLKSFWHTVFTQYWVANARAKHDTVTPLSRTDAHAASRKLYPFQGNSPVDSKKLLTGESTKNNSNTGSSAAGQISTDTVHEEISHYPEVNRMQEQNARSQATDQANYLYQKSVLHTEIVSLFAAYSENAAFSYQELRMILPHQVCQRIIQEIINTLQSKTTGEITVGVLTTLVQNIENHLPQLSQPTAPELLLGKKTNQIPPLEKVMLYAYAVYVQNGDIITNTKKLTAILQDKLLPLLKNHTRISTEKPTYEVDTQLREYPRLSRQAHTFLKQATISRDGISEVHSPYIQGIFAEREKNFSVTGVNKAFSALVESTEQLKWLKSHLSLSSSGTLYMTALIMAVASLGVLATGMMGGIDKNHSDAIDRIRENSHFLLFINICIFYLLKITQLYSFLPVLDHRYLNVWGESVPAKKRKAFRRAVLYPLLLAGALTAVQVPYGLSSQVRATYDQHLVTVLENIAEVLGPEGTNFDQDPVDFTTFNEDVSTGTLFNRGSSRETERSEQAMGTEEKQAADGPKFEVFGRKPGMALYWHQKYCMQPDEKSWYICGLEKFEYHLRSLPTADTAENLREFYEKIIKYTEQGYLVRTNYDTKSGRFEIPLGYEPIAAIALDNPNTVYTVLWNPYHSVQIKYAGKKTSTTTENASDPNTQTAVVYKKIPLTFSEQDISFFADDMIYQLADNPNLLHDMSTLDDLDLAGDSRLAPLDEILLAARNKQIAGEKLNTRELLEYLTREVITKLNVVYGFAKFDGDSLSQVPITEKLAKLMEHEPGKPLIWDCDQFAYVVKTLARSLSLDVHLDIGYLQSSLNNQGGHAQSGHMWIIYRQDGDPNWHLFEPTSYMPVTALIFNQTEYPTLLESLEAEEVNQKIKFSIFISLVGAVVVGGVTVNSRKIYKSIRQFSKDRSAQRLENTVADHEQEFLNAVSTFEQALMQSHSQSVHAVWAMLRSVLGVADVRLSSGKLETASGWYTLRGVIPVVQPNGEVALKSGELEPSEENAQLLAEEFLLTAINTDRHNDQLAPQTSEKLLVIINDLQRSGRDIIKRRQFSNAIFRKLFYNFFKDNFDEKRSKLYQGLQLVTSAIETELKSNPEKYLLQDNQAAADRVHQALDLLRQCKTLFEFDYRQL